MDKKIKILVVDDDPVIIQLIEEVLKSSGYDVAGTARSGEDAVIMANELKPDLILMDIMLPGALNGIQAAEMIKNKSNIPLIFITGYSEDKFIHDLKKVGPFGFILKPFSIAEIITTIDIALIKSDLETKLRESELKYRSLVECANDAIISLDHNGAILSFNQKAESIFKYSRDEVIGKNINLIVDKEYWNKGEEKYEENTIIKNVLKYLKNYGKTIEAMAQTKVGEIFPIELTIAPWESNEKTNFTCVIRDTTERKKSEEALRVSKSAFHNIVERSPDGIFIVNQTGDIRFANPAAENIFGRHRDELLNSPIGLPLTAGEQTEIDILKSNGEPGVGDMRVGETMWEGDFAYHISIRDITDKKNIEEELRRSEVNYHTIFDSANDAIFIHEFDTGEIIDVNEKMLKMFGYTKEEVKNINIGSLSSGESTYIQDDSLTYLKKTQKGEPQVVEWHARHKNGSLFWVEVNIKYAEIGGKSRVIAILRDISERKKAEEELKNTLNELKRSNLDLEQFANVESHDLQEPLRMVSSYVQLLEHRYKDRLDQDANDYISYAVEGSLHMRSMIKDLLTYSRVRTRPKEFEHVDTNMILKTVLTGLEVSIKNRGAIITHDELPNIIADKTQIRQVFQNLIGNAIKFCGNDPEIQVSSTKNDNEWEFSVTDNGIGIEPEYRDRIFTIFKRLHTRSEYPGSGIGLSICRNIIDRHDGRIWVEANENGGSNFKFTLPIRNENKEPLSYQFENK